ncbi:MAG TPA: sigma-54 dependent transcriptional regulator [Rhodospirillales bacterium]|jgi:two-component system nitrogen regulation response regulator NtrX|nr:sigma-54 dependent transcriptional regulator [Rhodospirillales bacterium]
MALDILIIDDESDICALCSGILEDEGYQTRQSDGSDSALASIESRRPSLVLLDIWLQGSELDGLGILEVLKKEHPDVPVVMMSGHGTIETAVAAINLGAYDFIEKPFNADRLLLVVERALEASRLRRENVELKLLAGTKEELIGDSPAIKLLRQAVDRVASTNSRILITGPAGSGKEVVGRMLHARSRRANSPFIVVSCATMEPEWMETELFGTESPGEDGEGRVGTFEAAHNGTLFLDEVADMPLETQGKIVRVLQEQVFERVGGKSRVEVDVRVVAATARELSEEIDAGRFRKDLFYRLSVVPLQVPPLKDRREDIPPLAGFFMERAAEALGQQQRHLAEDAIVVLQTYTWPGNVRELRNVIERLLIMSPGKPGEPIGADMLPSEFGGATPDNGDWERNKEMLTLPLRQARENFERQYLHSQVERFGGNISRTAAFVGMERSALHRKLKSLGIHNGNQPNPD